jgi:hypothetical protein
MSDALPPGKQILKRRANRRMPVADPLELFYAGVGYLGVFYESQLVYLKHELDANAAPDPADHLIKTLESAHAFAVNLISRNPVGVPLNQAVRELVEANRGAVQKLAVEGKDLVQRIQEERKRR